MRTVLSCSVRGCGLALERRERTLVCSRNHSFDISRSGYINLLQPQDRRSAAAGDAKPAIEARARLFASGIGRALVDTFVEQAVGLKLPDDAVVLDLGCGSGELLAELVQRRPSAAIGIDLATAAIDTAARRFPNLTWVVANADRRLPVLDRSIDLIVSFNGRRQPEECARVLRAESTLLVAVPAADDLIELRQQVLGEPVLRERVDALIGEHSGTFTAADRTTLRERHLLNVDQLRDLLHATYRGTRASAADRINRLHDLEVTFAFDVVRFVPKSPRRRSHATHRAQAFRARRRQSRRA